jgi:hypothetical protein
MQSNYQSILRVQDNSEITLASELYVSSCSLAACGIGCRETQYISLSCISELILVTDFFSKEINMIRFLLNCWTCSCRCSLMREGPIYSVRVWILGVAVKAPQNFDQGDPFSPIQLSIVCPMHTGRVVGECQYFAGCSYPGTLSCPEGIKESAYSSKGGIIAFSTLPSTLSFHPFPPRKGKIAAWDDTPVIFPHNSLEATVAHEYTQ